MAFPAPGAAWRRLVTSVAFVAALAVTAHPSGQTPRLSSWLQTALRQSGAADRHLIWIYFRDKGPDAERPSQTAGVTVRARQRRASRGTLRAGASLEDVP